MPAQDMAKSVMNKSLIAIKEHGIIFECPYVDDKENKKYKINYWVVGWVLKLYVFNKKYKTFHNVIQIFCTWRCLN